MAVSGFSNSPANLLIAGADQKDARWRLIEQIGNPLKKFTAASEAAIYRTLPHKAPCGLWDYCVAFSPSVQHTVRIIK